MHVLFFFLTEQGRGELQMGTKVFQCIAQDYQILEFGTHEETTLRGGK